MPDVSRTIGTVTEFSHRLDHHVISLPNPATQTDSKFERIRVQDDTGRTYLILVSDQVDYSIVRYRLDLAVEFAKNMSENEMETYLNTPLASDLDHEEDYIRAALVRIESEFHDELTDVQEELQTVLKSTGLETGSITTPADTPAGFIVSRKIFPEEDRFSIGRYSDCVRSVAVTGERGIDFLAKETDVFESEVDPDMIESEGTELEYRTFH